MGTVERVGNDAAPSGATRARGKLRARWARPRNFGVFACVAVAVLLASSVGGSAGSRVSSSAVSSATAAVDPTGAQQLGAAEASLAQGQGPAANQSVSCTSSGGGLTASCAVAAGATSTTVSTTSKWVSSAIPAARDGSAITYDGKDRYVVLFGGFTGAAYLNDTWEFVRGDWIQLPTPTAPSPRAGASIDYDAGSQYVVLYGGFDGSGYLSDTWKFLGGTWSLLSTSGPSGRAYASMAYDTRDGYNVLFGGWDGTTTYGATWELKKGVWSQLSPATAPAARYGSAVTFDSADNEVLLFGGAYPSGGGIVDLGDTWVYTAAGGWVLISASPAPSARDNASLVFDSIDNYAVLFGGENSAAAVNFGDTWTFVGGAWTLRTVSTLSGAPEARQSSAMAYDLADKYAVLYSGFTEGNPIAATDTWDFGAGVWSPDRATPQLTWSEPSGRAAAAIAFDPTDNYVVAFGGQTQLGPNGETWIFGAPIPGIVKLAPAWQEAFPASAPAPRAYASMAWDAHDGYIVLFGGLGAGSTALGDTWTYLGGTWTEAHPATSPSARYGAMMTYDVTDGYLLLFGGYDGSTYLSDTWEFQAGAWTPLSPVASPPARAFGGLSYSGKATYSVLFGGYNGAVLGDTWKFVAGKWSLLHPSVAPSARWGAIVMWDAKSNYVFLFGGCTEAVLPTQATCSSLENDSWAFGAGSWRSLSVSYTYGQGFISPRDFAMAALDPSLANTIVLYGGYVGLANEPYAMDRWGYISQVFNSWFPIYFPEARYGAVMTYDLRDQKQLIFGGIGATSPGPTGYLNDTWLWDTGVWGQAHPVHAPSARAYATLAYDPANRYTLLFGGLGATGYLGDTWQWIGSEAGGDWTEIKTSVAPSARANATMTYDTANGYMLLFGGQNSGGVLGDTWTFSSGVWAPLSPSASPSARSGASMVYDLKDGYVVLFGGWDGTSVQSDTWTFLSGSWTPLSLSTAPTARMGASIIYDPQDGFTLLFGGTNRVGGFDADTWGFLGGTWTEIASSKVQPVPSAFVSTGDDSIDGNVYLFGGVSGTTPLGDFWTFR